MATDYAKAYAIKNQWLNMSLYFINFMYNTRKSFITDKILALTSALVLDPFVFYYVTYKEISQALSYSSVNNSNVCSFITLQDRLKDNNNPIGGLQSNTKWLANGVFIQTDIIKMNKTDIINLYEIKEYGFAINKKDRKKDGTLLLNDYNSFKRQSNFSSSPSTNITNQERSNNNSNSTTWNDDELVYILKATNNNDILQYLINSKII